MVVCTEFLATHNMIFVIIQGGGAGSGSVAPKGEKLSPQDLDASKLTTTTTSHQ